MQEELYPQVLPQPDLKFPEVNRFLLISMDFTLVFQVIAYSNHETLPTPGFISLRSLRSSDILKYLQPSLQKKIFIEEIDKDESNIFCSESNASLTFIFTCS